MRVGSQGISKQNENCLVYDVTANLHSWNVFSWESIRRIAYQKARFPNGSVVEKRRRIVRETTSQASLTTKLNKMLSNKVGF